MDQEQKEAWLSCLCQNGKLDRRDLGQDESQLLKAFETWGLGYSLSEQYITLQLNSPLIDGEKIQSKLGDQFYCMNQLVTRSTNKDVLEYFDQHQQPCIAFAEMQLAGKGRRGNQWASPFAKNIYCTIGVLKSIQPKNLGLLSIVTGIALCQSLQACEIEGIQLKWPNDLYFEQHKLGGILIESRPVSVGEYFLAIGFGINVLMNDDDLAAIPQAATSVNRIKKGAASRDVILLEAIKQVVAMIDGFNNSRIPWLVKEFNARDALRGQRISATTGEQSIQGVNAGIDSSGQIQLDTEQGRKMFSAAEISLRGVG